jgi:pimeloyl-ACP methyl ester carboxylesterase
MHTKEYHISLNRKGLFIHHQENHEGRPTIVFLHDSLGCISLWRDFPAKLGKLTQCNILVYDRLGYGKSDPMPDVPRPVNYLEAEAETLNDLLNELSIEQPILFGHSDGGSIALLTAAKYPEKIKAVISEAAHVFVEEITLLGIREAMTAYQTTNLKERLEKYHGDNTDTLFRAWTQTWTRADFRNWNIESFLPAITCSVLVLQGTNDEFGSLAQVNSILNSVSGNAEKVLIEGSGHTPHKETPEETLAAVAGFINNLR